MVDIRTVGVIGAGQMGAGIAHVSALAGYDVLVNDVSVERVESALATINGNMARQIAKGAISDVDRKTALKRITPAKNLEALSSCDLVIEAAAESEPLKRQIFENLKPHLKPEAVVGSNTSSISITRLAAITG
ncbi:MAG: NAD(P)-binding domain-containing protein, partial [Hyphomicrobiales bacterium]|nr:NAD(P)-binding domain-containing protein [Hyphomicrobiales bacterium]